MPENKQKTVEVDADSLDALAENIKSIADGARRMMNSGLTEEAIIILLHDHSNVGKRMIKEVLRSLQCLDYYLIAKDKK